MGMKPRDTSAISSVLRHRNRPTLCCLRNEVAGEEECGADCRTSTKASGRDDDHSTSAFFGLWQAGEETDEGGKALSKTAMMKKKMASMTMPPPRFVDCIPSPVIPSPPPLARLTVAAASEFHGHQVLEEPER